MMDKEKSKINPPPKIFSVRINCLTFQKQELIVRNIIDNINMAKGILEKARFAEEIQKEMDVLLSCSGYDLKRSDCKNCRFIANLRKEEASSIIKAKNWHNNK